MPAVPGAPAAAAPIPPMPPVAALPPKEVAPAKPPAPPAPGRAGLPPPELAPLIDVAFAAPDAPPPPERSPPLPGDPPAFAPPLGAPPALEALPPAPPRSAPPAAPPVCAAAPAFSEFAVLGTALGEVEQPALNAAANHKLDGAAIPNRIKRASCYAQAFASCAAAPDTNPLNVTGSGPCDANPSRPGRPTPAGTARHLAARITCRGSYGSVKRLRNAQPTFGSPGACVPPCFTHKPTSTPPLHCS